MAGPDQGTGTGGATGPQSQEAAVARLAEPVLAYADRLPQIQGEKQADLLLHAANLLERFELGLQRAGIPGPAIPPARAALALVIDQRARANRAVNVADWGDAARRRLFDGRDVSVADLQGFVQRSAGLPDYAGITPLLAACLQRLETTRRAFDTSPVATNWAGMLTVLIGAYLLAMAGWAGWVEWRFHRDLVSAYATRAIEVGLDRAGPFADLGARLDSLWRETAATVETRDKAPVNLFAGITGQDAAVMATLAYQDTLQRHLPGVMTQAIDRALATEGEPAAAYDTLRAWTVLSGESEWQPAWLAGWAADRAVGDPALKGLAPHLMRLEKPPVMPTPPDGELLDQGRLIAAEASEPDRAYLELRRSSGVAGLPDWRPAMAVPGLTAILRRRSGLPIDTPLPGLYTQAGWDFARDFGAGLAVTAARDRAAALFDTPPPPQNDTPDLLMDRLLADTIARWQGWLADLRVPDFASSDVAVLVSGELARSASPLEQALREVWVQAGGTDRRRSHGHQLQLATAFGPMIQYVEGGRMQDIARLFAGLNVALAAQDRDEEKGQQRLMSVQDRAASVAALGVAPRVVAQIVEDTLAQTGAAHADLLSNDLTRRWQTEVLDACLAATGGRFPFDDAGADADPQRLADLLAPGGIIDRFVTTRAAEVLDRTETPWRWKPEARFEGLSPDSAIFLQRAAEIGAGLFPDGRLGATLTLSALAERGKATVSLGGNSGPVEAATESLVLAWPGPAPETGILVTFTTGEAQAQLSAPGLWGLLRLLAPLRLRERDNGQRFLVDLRAENARLFLEILFDRPQNPLAMRALAKGFACPPVL